VAAQIEALYQQCLWVRQQCFPQTASGTYLDQHAQLRGLSRRSGVKATGVLRFLVEEAGTTDLPIEAGTVCMTAGLTAFETTQDGVLAAGQTYVDIPAQAAEPGAGGNVGAGTVLSLSLPPVGIAACTNPAPFTGGTDEEDDETLRGRILATYAQMSNGANTAYYQQAALTFPGVAAASVVGRSRGIGTVDVLVVSEEGLPSEELVASLQAYFDEQREIAVDVQVLSPATVAVDVSVGLQVSEGYSFDQVAQEVKTAVNGLFGGSLLGKSVPRGKLISLIFGVAGVENCRLLSPTADLVGQKELLPVLGQLTITEWDGEA
jgi:uncharacterized phage protein gp47/JayE